MKKQIFAIILLFAVIVFLTNNQPKENAFVRKHLAAPSPPVPAGSSGGAAAGSPATPPKILTVTG